MTQRELERLEAEAAKQRRRFKNSWESLQEALPGSRTARPHRPHLRPQELSSLSCTVIDLCLFAVAAGCAIEIYRRISKAAAARAKSLPNPRLRIKEGDQQWKTPSKKLPRKALAANRHRTLPQRNGARPLSPDLANGPRQIN